MYVKHVKNCHRLKHYSQEHFLNSNNKGDN